MNITLDERASVDGVVVTLVTEHSVTVLRLPRNARRVTVERAGRGLSRLILGGFKSVTVTVTGPTAKIEQLKEAVLG